MKRVDLYIKVEVVLDEEETAEKVAREICRQVEKIYVVRRAELSNAVAKD
jgi:RNA-binding protein YhbY